jgi:hypothetical protein
MSFIGSWKIDDVLTFVANTQVFATGVATDADAVPAYRVYEDETTTPILTGTMALLDSANTAGFYSEAITLSAANGFEKGKCYSIYISATVSSVAGAAHKTFQMQAEVAVASMNAGTVTATAVADGAIDAATFAAGAITATVIADGAIDAATFAAGAITATVIADASIDAATFAAGAIDAAAISADAGAEIADAVLNRDMATGTDSGSATVRTVRQALRFLRNKWSISGTTLTVTKEDDATASWTSTVTATAGADPITANDPAGP